MNFNDEERSLAISAVGKCIDIFQEVLKSIEGVDSLEAQEKRNTYQNTKDIFDKLYMKIQQKEELDRKETTLFVSALNTTISSMTVLRNNYTKTIRELDNFAAEIIEKYLKKI